MQLSPKSKIRSGRFSFASERKKLRAKSNTSTDLNTVTVENHPAMIASAKKTIPLKDKSAEKRHAGLERQIKIQKFVMDYNEEVTTLLQIKRKDRKVKSYKCINQALLQAVETLFNEDAKFELSGLSVCEVVEKILQTHSDDEIFDEIDKNKLVASQSVPVEQTQEADKSQPMSINLVTNQQIDILSGTLNKLKRKDVEIWQIKMHNCLLNQPNFRWHSFISNELKQEFEMHVQINEQGPAFAWKDISLDTFTTKINNFRENENSKEFNTRFSELKLPSFSKDDTMVYIAKMWNLLSDEFGVDPILAETNGSWESLYLSTDTEQVIN